MDADHCGDERDADSGFHGADWLYGYDARNGKELWKLNYGILGFSNVSKPIVGHGMIYFSAPVS